MFLKIKEKDTELKFDIGFIRRLDNLHKANIEGVGVSFGAGILIANMQLQQYNPAMLSDIIYCATKGFKQQDVDEAIEQYAYENGDLKGLFDEVQDALGKSPMVKVTIENLKKQANG